MNSEASPETDDKVPGDQAPDMEQELSRVPSLEEREHAEFEKLSTIESLSEEEYAQFVALQDKKMKYEAAQKKLAHLVAVREDKEAQADAKMAPKEYVYIQHVGRNKSGRAMRRARAGYRRQGVVLDNGLRIRKKGRSRLTKVGLREFVSNHEKLLLYLGEGMIEVLEPNTMRPLTRDELVKGLGHLAEQYGKELSIPTILTPPSLLTAERAPDLMDDWEDGAGADDGDSEDSGEDNSEDIELSGTPDSADSTEETLDSEVSDTAESEDNSDGLPPEDAPEGEGEGYTEAELKKMSRVDLNAWAELNELDPEEYSSKAKLISALLGEEE